MHKKRDWGMVRTEILFRQPYVSLTFSPEIDILMKKKNILFHWNTMKKRDYYGPV